jgi:hypothetical protein
MKTRTLLLLSVASALAILLAGGVFLLQLSNETATVDEASIGEAVQVGDVTVTVTSFSQLSGATASAMVDIGGVDDGDGIDSFRLITGGDPLVPVRAPADGRCSEITVAPQQCRLDFDISSTEVPNRVLLLRRGDEQIRWDLTEG